VEPLNNPFNVGAPNCAAHTRPRAYQTTTGENLDLGTQTTTNHCLHNQTQPTRGLGPRRGRQGDGEAKLGDILSVVNGLARPNPPVQQHRFAAGRPQRERLTHRRGCGSVEAQDGRRHQWRRATCPRWTCATFKARGSPDAHPLFKQARGHRRIRPTARRPLHHDPSWSPRSLYTACLREL
jgi:hypothetical protein